MLVRFNSLEQVQNAVLELKQMSEPPSAIEFINDGVLEEIQKLNPNQIKEIIEPPFPPVLLLVEFDNNERTAKKLVKKAIKIFEKYALGLDIAENAEQQQQFWKLRESTSMLISHNQGLQHAVPVIDDGAVPVERLREYIEGIYSLLKNNGLAVAVWGHAGDGNLHMQPKLNVGQVGDRQKAFRLLEEYNKLVLKLGGTISSQTSDGRLKTPYLETMYGPEVYGLFEKIKTIFDPYGTLNPGVKFGTSVDDLKAIIRPDYSLDHLYDHLPRS
jgi:FAD/FMN-containing dehydrogenase